MINIGKKPKVIKKGQTAVLRFNHKATDIEKAVEGAKLREIDLAVKSLILGAHELCGDTRSQTVEFIANSLSDPNMILAIAMFMHRGIVDYQIMFSESMLKMAEEGELTDEMIEDFKEGADRECPIEMDMDGFARQMLDVKKGREKE